MICSTLKSKNVTDIIYHSGDFLPHSYNGKPGRVTIDNNTGETIFVGYYKRGQPHKEKGPALIHFENGKITRFHYYINGNPVL